MARRKGRFQNRKGIPNKSKPTPLTLSESIPVVCTMHDLARILRISERQIRYLEKQGTFPIPKLDATLDKIKRYRGDDVRRYLDGRDSSQVA